MADPRFFDRAGPFPLDIVAQRAGALLAEEAAQAMFEDVAELDRAGPSHVAFFDSRRHRARLARTQAGAILVCDDDKDLLPPSAVPLVTTEPYRAFARVADLFYPPSAACLAAIHAGCHLHPGARVGREVTIEAGAVVGEGAELGDGCTVGANAVIGRRCILGEGCVVGAGATITFALIGARTTVHAGARIGQDGFGFALGPAHGKVPQLGRVLIGDDVEIGANTTIDRGALGDTVIGSGTKIDNLVQIAHNVVIGEHCVIVAQSGISGSAVLGHHVVVAAQSGITGHLTIGAGARLAARTAVIGDLPGGEDYGGQPALPAGEWRRQMVAIRRLGRRR